MNDEVSWILTARLATAQPKVFEGLMVEMVKAAQAMQTDTTAYVWYLYEDGQSCEIFTNFRDSNAAMLHLTWFSNTYAQQFMDTLQPTSMTVYGKPSQELRNALASFSPRYVKTVGGFAR
ncbi:hypothetical protein PsAD2_02482 [Pseudovibrio axinellae]|uniref:ABM domain-containing protein n=1 Tax=Pseudovibrio axinellae TaxID=989403 RepID=A0A165YLV7_9HYPH|nr:hypothetical protein [Pseudovibrio axinellae]KZL18964.1 hypothetical protein PsAD2_02482 [Pseudovibrio axinellae]SEP85964.1 hypothetical protein SAMN05421798_101559 [Pseudovibrio axinellae]